jgi:hypothetical protein
MATNWRMKNLFELAPFLGCRKNNGAKCAPIQLSIFRKNGVAECSSYFGKHVFIMMRELACHGIGIKERGFRQEPAQALYKGRFTAGNTACHSDRWHLPNVAQISYASPPGPAGQTGILVVFYLTAADTEGTARFRTIAEAIPTRWGKYT